MDGLGRVFVVDDDAGMRESVKLALETAGLEAEGFVSAEAFLEAGMTGGCLVLDLRLGGMSGLELLQRLRARGVGMPVVMVTGHGDVPAAVQSMKLGAVDFLEKPVEPRVLVGKVTEVLAAAREREAKEGPAAAARERLGTLSKRELELLKLLVAGLSSKQVAGELGISTRTVEHHRAHLLEKTGAGNIAELVRLAVLAGVG